MLRLSIARSLGLALGGLTVVLAVVAGLSVSSLYDARRDFEDVLARSYAVEVATANLLAASVVEETVLRSARIRPRDRRRAAAAFATAARAAARAARDDPPSASLVDEIRSAELRGRRAAPRPGSRPRRRAPALAQVSGALAEGRRAAARLAERQAARRREARDEVARRSRRATAAAAIAGGLAIAGALALVALLVTGLRRPLAELVAATRRMSSGDLAVRVEPAGPAELRQLSASFNAMAADLDAARERIEAGRRRLAATIESLGDALVICDAAGRVVQVNPRAADLVPELVPGRDLAADAGPLPELGDALDREAVMVHRGRTLSVTAARMGPGHEDGVVWTIRDVTERARLERAKSDFVATASHELRSPLTSIKGFVELLAAGELPDREREFAEVILISTNRLVDMVNDLLDVARVEAGHLEIQRRPVAVSEAVDEVTALMRPRVEGKGQTLAVEVPPALPAAYGDPARIRQILTNLITNAHLYTPGGGTIGVRAGARGGWVTLAVSDTGPGISAEQQERLFERFYRGEGSQASPGTGLGMSIVRSLVELHAGEIEVDSARGRGTTIIVRIPRVPGSGETGGAGESIRGRRILVVDDEPDVARVIDGQLRAEGVDVVVAESVADAERRLRAERFDAVAMDILVGDSSGFELLRTLREDPDLRRVPVVVVSVLAGEAALAGEWTVSKPIDADELTDAIGAAIMAGRARVLVVARAALRPVVGPMLDRRGVDHVWATSAAQARRLCEEHRFEVALVDAGMRSPQAALAQLDLRGRRLRRSVVVFSTGDRAPGLVRLRPDPVPLERATRAVVEALSSGEPSREDARHTS